VLTLHTPPGPLLLVLPVPLLLLLLPLLQPRGVQPRPGHVRGL
jgi:hypothetical protein